MTPRDPHAVTTPEEVAAALRELDIPADEVSALTPVIESLQAWQAPVPTITETRLFLARLEDRLTETAPLPASWSWRSRIALLWQIGRRQPRLIHRSVWAGSLVAMICAMCLAWFGLTRQGVALGLFVPAIAATCVAFLYGPEVDPSLECVKAMPVSVRFLVGSRLVTILGYEVALGLATTAALALHGHESFGALVTLWLGPMALLSSCSLLLSLLLGPAFAAGSMFAAWFIQFVQIDRGPGILLLAGPHWQTSPLLFAGAFVIVLLGFWLLPASTRLTLPSVITPENQL